jgi:DnaD/phage-associated family protein
MSVVVTSRIYWTQFENIEYQEKNGKIIKIGKLAAKSVMSAIGDSADDFGENSWQGFETIAEKSSVERRSVIRITRGLIACGWLSVKEVSRYGTNNFSITMDKLGYPPRKRSVNGRPKGGDVQSPVFQSEAETSDSGAETSDSGAETGDSQAETGDPESPYPSFNHPLSSQPQEAPVQKNLFALYSENFGALTSMIGDEINDLEQTYTAEWVKAAFVEAVSNEARNLKYVAAILKRWKTEGFKSRKEASHGKKSSPDRGANSAGQSRRRSEPTPERRQSRSRSVIFAAG